MSCVLVAFLTPSPIQMLIVAACALLLYGGDLPKVVRSWGKSFSQFRRSLSGIQKDINEAIYSEPEKLEYHPEQTSYADDSADEPTNASIPDDDLPDEDSPEDDSPNDEPAAAERN